ncbi:hypothetical protein G9A89_000322 [Geosiphon pyriformis]|nr:hypothetical protein G9A89_000322 [Geosiphon pyriformis]
MGRGGPKDTSLRSASTPPRATSPRGITAYGGRSTMAGLWPASPPPPCPHGALRRIPPPALCDSLPQPSGGGEIAPPSGWWRTGGRAGVVGGRGE